MRLTIDFCTLTCYNYCSIITKGDIEMLIGKLSEMFNTFFYFMFARFFAGFYCFAYQKTDARM